MPETFESVLQARVDHMADACTRCGKCVEVCPATEPAGLTVEQRGDPVRVIEGVISNGLAPRIFSSVGSVVSENCT